LWEQSVDGAHIFILGDLYSVQEWNEIEKAYDFAVSKFGETFKRIIYRDKFCLVKIFVEERFSEWREKGSTCENILAEILIFTCFNMKYPPFSRIYSELTRSVEVSTISNLLTIKCNF
jgi:hypothetical protein